MNYKIFLSCVFVTSCITPNLGSMALPTYVKNLASFEFQCEQENVKINKVGDNSYTAEGCSKKGVYTCKNEAPWYAATDYTCEKK